MRRKKLRWAMYPNSRISIAAFTCALSDLAALSKTTGQPGTIFNQFEPVLLSVTLEFSGSGAIAFVPLAAAIQVDFLAKSLRSRQELELGAVTLTTSPKQLIYTPAISLADGFDAAGCEPNQAYLLSAVVYVGAIGFPALLTGMIDGLMIQIYD